MHTGEPTGNGAIALQADDALVIVDVQRDFLPGGALGVREASGLLDTLNAYIALFVKRRLPVIATRDWHPAGHCSFTASGGPWPPHCIADSPGAQFPDALALPCDTVIVDKATGRERDAYSGFQGTDLAQRLRALGVRRVFVGGLATDYCVMATVLDALQAGFEAFVLEDAVRAVDVNDGDGDRAMARMLASGAAGLELGRLAG